MVPTSKGDQNMSRPEDQCNLDDLQALTMGTENLMFPTDDTDTPMGQIPVPHGVKLDSAVIPQAEVHQPLSIASRDLANQPCSPGTMFVDAAKNWYIIDAHGYAVPVKRVMPGMTQSLSPISPSDQIIKCSPSPPAGRRRAKFQYVSINRGTKSKVKSPVDHHLGMNQRVWYDRFYSCSTNRYGADSFGILALGSDTSLRSNALNKVGSQADPQYRKCIEGENSRRELIRNGISPQVHVNNISNRANDSDVSDAGSSHTSGNSRWNSSEVTSNSNLSDTTRNDSTGHLHKLYNEREPRGESGRDTADDFKQQVKNGRVRHSKTE